MKTLLILSLSLAGNIALLAVLVRTPGASASLKRSLTVSSPTGSETEEGSSAPSVATASTTATVSASGATPVQAGPLWPRISSDDPRVFAQQLADAGFPPAVIRSVIEDQVRRQFQVERRKLRPDESSLPYWQAPQRGPADREFFQRLQELGVEQQRVLREALGPQRILDNETRLAWMRRQYGVSDPQKLLQLSAILEDYQEVGMEAFGDAVGPDPTLREETQRLIQQEQLADIAAVLTPEEFAAYELRASPFARNLRSSLRDFEPTEAEYRALFAAYRAGETSAGDANFDHTRLLERTRALLPLERHAELQQAVAPGASGINSIARRLNLPLPAVAPAYEAQRELRERANTVRRDRALTPEQRNVQLAAIGEEATQRIKAVLGERGFAVYRERGGSWIDGLTASPDAGLP